MDNDFIELLKTRSDSQLLADISLGEDSFQQGYYDYFIQEANRRGLNFKITDKNKSLYNEFDPTKFHEIYKSQNIKIKNHPKLLIISCICSISIYLYYILFFIQQYIYFDGIVSTIYSITLVVLILIVCTYPVIKVIQLVNLYKFLQKLNNIDNSFTPKKTDVLLSIFIPFIGFIYSVWIIYKLLINLERIKTKEVILKSSVRIFILIQSCVFSLFQVFFIYQIISEYQEKLDSLT